MTETKGLMTEGVIWKKILLFSLPLLLGNVFQQLYNTVDSIIVGNYIGGDALAAVGTSGPIINLLVGFFMGIATGAGVVIARYFGARDEQGVYVAYGNSIVVDPWGTVVSRMDGAEDYQIVELDMGRVADVRAQLPLMSARRADLYTVERK